MKHILSAAVTVAALSVGSTAFATPLTDTYSSFWVLGDSLSDNGNLFDLTMGTPPPPYVDGRFSNGPVWNEDIIEDFRTENGQTPVSGNLGGALPFNLEYNGNFAFGGARADNDPNANGLIPSLFAQIFEFGNTVTPADLGLNPLVSVWAGANDIFQDLPGATNLMEIADVGTDAANAVLAGITALTTAGINNILTFNLPDIGKSPEFNIDANKSFAGTVASQAFNTRLETGLSTMTANIMLVDVAEIFDTIIADPLDFGFENVEDQCLQTLDCVLGETEKQNTFLFWDGVHPTASAHALIQKAAIAAAVPLPAGLPLLLVSFGVFAVMRRKQQA